MQTSSILFDGELFPVIVVLRLDVRVATMFIIDLDSHGFLMDDIKRPAISCCFERNQRQLDESLSLNISIQLLQFPAFTPLNSLYLTVSLLAMSSISNSSCSQIRYGSPSSAAQHQKGEETTQTYPRISAINTRGEKRRAYHCNLVKDSNRVYIRSSPFLLSLI